jgi:hypothetical protein
VIGSSPSDRARGWTVGGRHPCDAEYRQRKCNAAGDSEGCCHLVTAASLSQREGTLTEDEEHNLLQAADVVTLARTAVETDYSGGPGWQLLAAPGKRGVAGEKGQQGDRGPTGPSWPAGKDAQTRLGNRRLSLTVTPVMSNGISGPPLDLRGLFQQFLRKVG